jgi:DNA-binding IclR family transcriptional regulator
MPGSSIQTIDRAVAMLGMFSVQELNLGLFQLTDRFGLGRSTTHRYATSLRENGLLRYDNRTGRYSLGIRLIQLGQLAQVALHVVQAAGPHLERAADALNETVVLSIWDGEAPVVVRISEAPRRTTYLGVRIGSRLGPRTAQCRIFRAYLSPAPLKSPDLAEIVKHGVAIVTNPEDDVRALACPIHQGGQVVAAMALLGTPRRIPRSPGSSIASRLRAAAEKLSAELNGSLVPGPSAQGGRSRPSSKQRRPSIAAPGGRAATSA